MHREDLYSVPEQHVSDKPLGLWYSCGIEWIEWVAMNMPDWIEPYVYGIRLNPSGLVALQTPEALDRFTSVYGVRGGRDVDWQRVANDYAGIEICPYQWERRRAPHAQWYSAWDVASGCVWDMRAVEDLVDLTPAAGPLRANSKGRDHEREGQLAPEARQLVEEWVAAMSAAGVGRVRWSVAYEALESGDPEVYDELRGAIASLRKRAADRARWDAEEAEQAAWDAQAEEVDPYRSARQLDRRLAGKHVWLYHGTSTALLPRILDEGLSHEQTPIDRDTTPGFVYLTALPANSGRGDAIFYAQRAAGWFGGEPVVLRVIVPWDDLSFDEDDADISTGRYQFRYAGTIPPEWIREVGDQRR